METNFNDIQQLWQSKKASDFDLPALIKQMKATEKKQKLEWTIALACTPITMIILVYALPLKDSLLGVLTLLVIAFGMAWVIWLNSKALLRTVEDSESYSQRSFVEDQLHKLQLRGKIIQKHMITYGLLIAFAINMGYLEVLSPLSVKFRILAHLGATGMIAGVMWYTLRKKKKTFENESRPMILQLEKLLAEMKS
jgi:1,4-dihydroxy-2-naphthoate octaprenyltransferase